MVKTEPQLDNNGRSAKSAVLAPVRLPVVMPVSVTLPVLVSVKAWDGSKAHAALCRIVVPGQFRVVAGNAYGAGVSVAETTAATPLPVSETGEPVTATLAFIATWPPTTRPSVVGLNTMLNVQVAPAARVAPQVPPGTPAGRAKGPVNIKPIPVAAAVPVLWRVRVCAALVVPSAWFPKFSVVGVTLSIAVAAPPLVGSTAPIAM